MYYLALPTNMLFFEAKYSIVTILSFSTAKGIQNADGTEVTEQEYIATEDSDMDTQ
jgi:hypothetical protein